VRVAGLFLAASRISVIGVDQSRAVPAGYREPSFAVVAQAFPALFNSLELAEIHDFLDEPPRRQECAFDVRDDARIVERRCDEQCSDIVVYFVVAPGICPIAEETVLRQCDHGFVKAVRMRDLDRMQRVLQDHGDVWKVRCAMVVKYLDQKIAAVKYRPNAESNQVCHGSFFCSRASVSNDCL